MKPFAAKADAAASDVAVQQGLLATERPAAAAPAALFSPNPGDATSFLSNPSGAGPSSMSAAAASSYMCINPATLTITPQQYELEFWRSSRVTHQLVKVDKSAFIMSSLNIYSGWNAAAGLQAAPMCRSVLQGLCVMYLLLSIIHQWYIKYRLQQYLDNRDGILTATRLCRGSWMIVMFLMTRQIDIYNYFIVRRLNQGLSPQAIVAQLLSLFTLILLGQCLYYPMKFRHAVLLQLLYVGGVLGTANTVRCILQSPALVDGTRLLCEVVQSCTDSLNILLGLGEHTSNVMCGERVGEELLASWMICFGFLVPLYVLYTKELAKKQQFLRQKQRQRLQEQQRGVAACCFGPPVNLGPLLHVTAVSTVLVLGLACAEMSVLLSKPVTCSVE